MSRLAPQARQFSPQQGLSRFPTTVPLSDTLPSELISGEVASAGVSKQVSRSDHKHAIPAFASQGFIGWCIPSFQIGTQANPTPLSWAFALKLYLPVPHQLRGYGFGLTTAGLASHGVIRAAVWTHDYENNCPLARYHDSRLDIRVAGMAAGWNQLPAAAWGSVLCTVAAGTAWLVVTIQCDPGRSITSPPLVWLDGRYLGSGNCYKLVVGTAPGFIKEPFDLGAAVPQQAAPGLFLV